MSAHSYSWWRRNYNKIKELGNNPDIESVRQITSEFNDADINLLSANAKSYLEQSSSSASVNDLLDSMADTTRQLKREVDSKPENREKSRERDRERALNRTDEERAKRSQREQARQQRLGITSNAAVQKYRANLTEEQREAINAKTRERQREMRANWTEEQWEKDRERKRISGMNEEERAATNAKARERQQKTRANWTEEEREKERGRKRRSGMTEEQIEEERARDRERKQLERSGDNEHSSKWWKERIRKIEALGQNADDATVQNIMRDLNDMDMLLLSEGAKKYITGRSASSSGLNDFLESAKGVVLGLYAKARERERLGLTEPKVVYTPEERREAKLRKQQKYREANREKLNEDRKRYHQLDKLKKQKLSSNTEDVDLRILEKAPYLEDYNSVEEEFDLDEYARSIEPPKKKKKKTKFEDPFNIQQTTLSSQRPITYNTAQSTRETVEQMAKRLDREREEAERKELLSSEQMEEKPPSDFEGEGIHKLLKGCGMSHILMPKKQFVKEHKKLLKVLKEAKPKALKKEYEEQKKELKEKVGGRKEEPKEEIEIYDPNRLFNDARRVVNNIAGNLPYVDANQLLQYFNQYDGDGSVRSLRDFFNPIAETMSRNGWSAEASRIIDDAIQKTGNESLQRYQFALDDLYNHFMGSSWVEFKQWLLRANDVEAEYLDTMDQLEGERFANWIGQTLTQVNLDPQDVAPYVLVGLRNDYLLGYRDLDDIHNILEFYADEINRENQIDNVSITPPNEEEEESKVEQNEGGSKASGFIQRMMAEVKMANGSYKPPTNRFHPDSTMNKKVAFDYFKMPKESRDMSKHIMTHLFRIRPYKKGERETLNETELKLLRKAELERKRKSLAKKKGDN